MTTLHDVQERREQAVAEMRSLTDQAQREGRDLSDTEARRFDTLKGQVAGYDKQAERLRTLQDMERRAETGPAEGDAQWAEKRREFSLTRAIAGASGFSVDDGREREIGQEIRNRTGRTFAGTPVPVEALDEKRETRALTSASGGGDLVATDHEQAQFIDRLRENVVVRRLGARVLRGLTGNVDIPRLATSATTGWVAENSALSASDHTFDSVALAPKHAGALTELSRNMLQQASPDVENLVRQDFAAILARTLDRVAIQGGGTNEPTGIIANGNVATRDLSTLDWDSVLDLIGALEDANAQAQQVLTNPKVVRKLRQTNKVGSTPEHGFIMESRDRLDNITVTKTNLVPVTSGSPDTSEIIVGDFSDLLIGFWSELDVLTNPYEGSAYARGNIQVRAMMTADVALRHPESFARGTNVDVS